MTIVRSRLAGAGNYGASIGAADCAHPVIASSVPSKALRLTRKCPGRPSKRAAGACRPVGAHSS